MRRIVQFAFAGLFAGLVVTGGVSAQEEGLGELFRGLLPGGGQEGESAAPDVTRRVPFSQNEIRLSFAPLVAEAAPAVVNVYASQEVEVRSPFMGDPFFEQFFNRQMPPRVQSSLGSGVIVDEAGYIVTNHHVIRNADKVRVALSDGREFESEILLKDESLDLAVLKIEGEEPFAAVDLGNSDALAVGDLVLAIGNPFGVGQTTTSGIVSALARTHIGISDFGFFIQTDAAINPGNSGGALIDMSGDVIGINTAIFSRTGGSIGIGFAIPSNIVRVVVKAAKEGSEYFERPYVGAEFEAVTPQIAEALGLKRPTGALVSSVVPDGPAALAGLKPGDVVLAVDGRDVQHPDALGYRLATVPLGDALELAILASGERRTVELTPIRAPGGDEEIVAVGGQGPFAGAHVAELSPRLAQRLQMSGKAEGVVVLEVERGSPAARVGLRPGDIVHELNGVEIDGAQKLASLAQQSGSRWWRFTLERDGRLLRQTLRY